MIFSHIPDIDGKVVSRKDVVLGGGCEFGARDRVDKLGKKVFLVEFMVLLEFVAALIQVGRLPQVAQADVAVRRAVNEGVGSGRVKLAVGDDLRLTICFDLELGKVVRDNFIPKVPQVNVLVVG